MPARPVPWIREGAAGSGGGYRLDPQQRRRGHGRGVGATGVVNVNDERRVSRQQ
ncbi:hypothetical protein JYU34_018326 [Plutella xylostella]|uniref:Uncharacterized protein n=1 Tax=Plutella xylostella TaxID=51655 RepID=A0ABQ7Q0D8_PLUXY|nr:hypothetical protein JYU34_018326 [Plutella xylostella]